MALVYHLVTPDAWQTGGEEYRADSLAAEGFIHCSFGPQVAAAGNKFYSGKQDLLLLHIDPDQLTSPLRVEPSGSGELFPHIYGPINRSAVLLVEPLRRGAGGLWIFEP
jgi:uncharacterized protein (DUF952 family)